MNGLIQRVTSFQKKTRKSPADFNMPSRPEQAIKKLFLMACFLTIMTPIGCSHETILRNSFLHCHGVISKGNLRRG